MTDITASPKSAELTFSAIASVNEAASITVTLNDGTTATVPSALAVVGNIVQTNLAAGATPAVYTPTQFAADFDVEIQGA